MHRVVIHLCSPLLCQTSWLQRQLLKDGIILITIFVGIVSVQHQVLTISLSHGIVTMPELVYRMLVTLLYVSKQWGVINAPAFPDDGQPVTFPVKFSKIPSVITAINQAKNSVSSTQLFTASINAYTTTSNMILHRYGGLTASDVRVDWFAWGV